jgi:hypothetical protein
LAARLTGHHGSDAVDTVCLPGHGAGVSPAFDESAFLAALAAVIDRQLVRGLPLVLLGHSTGGSLLLVEIARRLAEDPTSLNNLLLLVLCATPPCIDLSYTRRRNALTADWAIEMHDIASLVTLVNRLAPGVPPWPYHRPCSSCIAKKTNWFPCRTRKLEPVWSGDHATAYPRRRCKTSSV